MYYIFYVLHVLSLSYEEMDTIVVFFSRISKLRISYRECQSYTIAATLRMQLMRIRNEGSDLATCLL